jgi:NRPS condensation-like uncharacterized protein/acyl carrier protein
VRAEFVEPENEREQKILSIWQEALSEQKISMLDNFFDLGGQSLLATRMMSLVRETFAIDIPLRKLFEGPTIRSLANNVQAALDGSGFKLSKIEAQPRPEFIPLSSSQKRLWFLSRLNENDSAYHIPLILNLKGNLNKDKLDAAFTKLVERHESLRSNFLSGDGEPYQLIHTAIDWRVEQLDATEMNEAQLYESIKRLSLKKFNLSKDSLLRVALFEKAKGEHVLLIIMHHIISDAWSLELLLKEALTLYQGQTLRPLELQFADYALWQKQQAQENAQKQGFEFWREYLSEVPVLQLPYDCARPAFNKNEGASVQAALGSAESQSLKRFCKDNGFTEFMVLLAAFQVLMAKYSGQKDFAVGTPVANREQSELQSLIGFFVNTLAIRSEVDETLSFIELCNKLKNTLIDVYEKQSVPFEDLVDELAPRRDLSMSPLFQVMMIFNGESSLSSLSLNEFEISSFEVERFSAKFDLSLEINQNKNSFTLNLEYNTALFESNTAQQLLNHFQSLLALLLSATEEKVLDICFLSAKT